jgi:ABC-2 type transport system permease protein
MRLPSRWWLILAIAYKDILNTIKTPASLVVLFIPLMMMMLFRLLFTGLTEPEPLAVAIYDPSGSPLAAQLQLRPELVVQVVESRAALEAAVVHASAGILAPADWPKVLAEGRRPEITVLLNPQAGAQTELATFQRVLAEQLWQMDGQDPPVQLTWMPVTSDITAVTREVDSFLMTLLLIMGMGMASTLISILVVQEKDEQTLAALLLSPAGRSDVMAGKGLAGFVFTLLAPFIMLALWGRQGSDWPIILSSILVGALFMVGVGLLIGVVFDTKQQCNSWGSLLILLLLVPTMLLTLEPTQLWLDILVRLLPTYYLTSVLSSSLKGAVPAAEAGLNLAVVAGSTLVVLIMVNRRLRRSLTIVQSP